MRNLTLLFILTVAAAAFMQCGNSNSAGNRLKEQAVSTARDHLLDLTGNGNVTTDKEGVITITAGSVSYLIDPSGVFVEEINEDGLRDAIVPVTGYDGSGMIVKKHLILINSDRGMVLDTVLNDVVRVLKVEDRIIYAELSKVSMDSPYYGCAECVEIASYRFRGNKLEKLE